MVGVEGGGEGSGRRKGGGISSFTGAVRGRGGSAVGTQPVAAYSALYTVRSEHSHFMKPL